MDFTIRLCVVFFTLVSVSVSVYGEQPLASKTISDYKWLEKESDDRVEWVREQNGKTNEFLRQDDEQFQTLLSEVSENRYLAPFLKNSKSTDNIPLIELYWGTANSLPGYIQVIKFDGDIKKISVKDLLKESLGSAYIYDFLITEDQINP